MPWQPIQDLPQAFEELTSPELASLDGLWKERAEELADSGALRDFNLKLKRRWAIETGLIERLYTLDRGITRLLVEQGIDAALIPHGTTGKDPEWVAAVIADQFDAAEGLFDFVGRARELSPSYIKELHQALTRNQLTTTAQRPDRTLVEVPLLRGEFKTLPNNPQRPDGTTHEYAPPEQVASEIDRLVEMHLAHEGIGVTAEVEAAWLHHRFTQIHPFQDGNGRVARALATLVFLRAGLFPPVVRDEEDRGEYIRALEIADAGELGPLVNLFARVEKASLLGAISLSTQVIDEQRDMGQLIAALARDAAATRDEEESAAADRARQLARAISDEGQARMRTLQTQLREALGAESYRVFVDAHSGDQREAAWYRADVIDFAAAYGYYANFEAFKGWVRLKLVDVRRQLQDEIVVAVHGVGRDFRGGISAIAFSIRREATEDTHAREVRKTVLSREPFSLTHLEDEGAVLDRFRRWLEPVLVIAIDGFRRAIANGA